MNPRLRHDAILRQLRRSDFVTVDEIARETGTSRRTVLRDIGTLREQGYLIHSESGRGGGLRLDPQSAQSTVRITVTEIFALVLSIASFQAARWLPFSELADSGLAKIERSLPPDKIPELRRLLACLHVGQISPTQDLSGMGALDPSLLSTFEAAFLQRLHLRFRYRDAKGRESLREVEPQAMLILPPLWYIVGWDVERQDFRHFRMDRIQAPELVAGARFRPRHVPFEKDICPFRS